MVAHAFYLSIQEAEAGRSASVIYRVSSRTVSATQRSPVLPPKKEEKKKGCIIFKWHNINI